MNTLFRLQLFSSSFLANLDHIYVKGYGTEHLVLDATSSKDGCICFSNVSQGYMCLSIDIVSQGYMQLYASRMSHKETCGSFLSRNLVEEQHLTLKECFWNVSGESVSWGECLLERVFPGESIS